MEQKEISDIAEEIIAMFAMAAATTGGMQRKRFLKKVEVISILLQQYRNK